MRSDSDIKRDVESELRGDPDIDSTDIAVAVKDAVVTLAGFVRSYKQRRQAEAAWPVLRMTSKLGCPLSSGGPIHKSRTMPTLPYGRNYDP
jgi:hypothetical protein